MGRKKRKVEVAAQPDAVALPVEAAVEAASSEKGEEQQQQQSSSTNLPPTQQPAAAAPAAASSSSAYAVTSHSGEITQKDNYFSDGSDNEQDAEVEVVLVGSRMGMMRRGLHHPSMLVQPNRQWVRQDDHDKDDEAAKEQQQRQQEEEELAKLDPAQRAARLLQEKQRKLEEAQKAARLMESEENAGRDPMLFSKRTAYDIRFDQIEDKPWMRGHGEMSDFFNYGLLEEDWLEYAQQQLLIRQELIDAARQKRNPDPSIVPVMPRLPKSAQLDVTAAAKSSGADEEGIDAETMDTIEAGPSAGPALKNEEDTTSTPSSSSKPDTKGQDVIMPDAKPAVDVQAGVGGAWGAGAAPGSVLARLIEEQEQQGGASSGSQQHPAPASGTETPWSSSSLQDGESHGYGSKGPDEHESNNWNRPDEHYGRSGDYYGGGGGRGGWQSNYPPPPPPPNQGFRGRGRGFGGGRFGGRGDRGGRGPPPQWAGHGGDFYSRKRPREGGWRR